MSLATLYTGNTKKASQTFKKLTKQFPKNLQTHLITTYFLHNKFTEFGDPLFSQEKTIKIISTIVRKHPDNVAILAF